jgi:hypothetical protein
MMAESYVIGNLEVELSRETDEVKVPLVPAYVVRYELTEADGKYVEDLRHVRYEGGNGERITPSGFRMNLSGLRTLVTVSFVRPDALEAELPPGWRVRDAGSRLLLQPRNPGDGDQPTTLLSRE